jgi:hypothetical protein
LNHTHAFWAGSSGYSAAPNELGFLSLRFTPGEAVKPQKVGTINVPNKKSHRPGGILLFIHQMPGGCIPVTEEADIKAGVPPPP